jgi:hypothetical protein
MAGDTLEADLHQADSAGVLLVDDNIWDDSKDLMETIEYSNIKELRCDASRSNMLTLSLIGFTAGFAVGIVYTATAEDKLRGSADAVHYLSIPTVFGIMGAVSSFIVTAIINSFRDDLQFEINGSRDAYLHALPTLREIQYLDDEEHDE